MRQSQEQEPRQPRQNYDKASRTENNKQSNSQKPTWPVYQRFESYTPLNIKLEQILNAITHEPYVRRPRPFQPGANTDQSKYCAFHENQGHTTNDCAKLRDEVEFLIRKGHLKEFVDA